jgi:hypothetical protein
MRKTTRCSRSAPMKYPDLIREFWNLSGAREDAGLATVVAPTVVVLGAAGGWERVVFKKRLTSDEDYFISAGW